MYCLSTEKLSRFGAFVLLACCHVIQAHASDAFLSEKLRVNGFVSQGFVYTSANRFFGHSDDGSLDYTELGLNASTRLRPDLLLAGQLLVRRAGGMYDGTPALDYGLVDWTAFNSGEMRLGLRVGRLKNPLGLYNETRDVATTRPSVFLPQAIYFDKVRNLVHSSDGIGAYAELHRDFGSLSTEVALGLTRVDTNVEAAYLFRDFGGRLENDGPSLIGRLQYFSPDMRWRAALSVADSDMRFRPAPGDPVTAGQVSFVYWVASLQYQAERWSVAAEYMLEPIRWDGFGPLLDQADATAEAWYIQGSYRLSETVELVTRYEEGYANRDDRSGKATSAASGGFLPAITQFQKDWMIGVRWDVTPTLMLRAEYQYNVGTFTLSQIENPDFRDLDRRWHLFSLLASYRF